MDKCEVIERRLGRLLESIEDPRSAYAIRSRLDRLVLSLQQHLPEVADSSEVAHRVDRVADSFAVLRLKSEPFGEPWRVRLSEARNDLLIIQKLLR